MDVVGHMNLEIQSAFSEKKNQIIANLIYSLDKLLIIQNHFYIKITSKTYQTQAVVVAPLKAEYVYKMREKKVMKLTSIKFEEDEC